METPINTPFYLDKALWLAVFAPLCLLLGSKLGIVLDPTVIVGFILPVVGYILSNKWKTTVLQKATIQAAGEVVVPTSAGITAEQAVAIMQANK